MNDRFEMGRDLGIAILRAITEHNNNCKATMGDHPTVFEIIGVLQMIANDYHNQLRNGSVTEKDAD